MCYVPAAFAAFVVREREVNAKHQQTLSGVSLPGESPKKLHACCMPRIKSNCHVACNERTL